MSAAYDIFPPGKQFFDDDGNVLNAGYLYVYTNDQAYSTQATVYKDAAKQTQWTQPITLGADGRLTSPVKSDQRVDVKIFDSDDNPIETHNNAGEDFGSITPNENSLLQNGSAEEAGASDDFAFWTTTDAGAVVSRSTAASYHGAAEFLFTGASNGSEYITSDAFSVTPGRELKLGFSLYANNASAQPKVSIQWLTGAGADISTSVLYLSDEGETPTSWERAYGISITPPSTARKAKLIVFGNMSATAYTVHFDDFVVVQQNTFEFAPVIPFGLKISPDTDTDHDLNVTAGAVRDSANAYDMILRTEITKRFDASWASGDDAGGDDGSGLPASGPYYVWLIMNSSSGSVDVLGSTSPTSPTMPSGYDVKRRLGFWHTDSSNNFVGGSHNGNTFYFHDAIEDVNDSTITDGTFETGTLSVPPNSIAFINLSAEYTSTGDDSLFATVRPVGSSSTKHTIAVDLDDDTSGTPRADEVWTLTQMLVDGSSQLEYTAQDKTASDGSAITVKINTFGAIDLGRDYP